MSNTEMLARLRMMLDEATDGFWKDDDDLYPALTDGQLEAFKIIFNRNPKDRKLQPLMKDASGTIAVNYIDIPSDMWENFIIAADWAKVSGNDKVYCDIVSYDTDLQYAKSNSYKTPVSSQPIAYIKSSTSIGNRIYFEPAGTSSDYLLTYLTTPTAIDSSTNPQITSSLHFAVVLFAFQSVIRKTKQPDLLTRADNELKNFIGIVNNAG